MNHIIKGIVIVVAISSLLIVGATSMFPIIQNSFAGQGSINPGTISPNTSTLQVVLNNPNSVSATYAVTVTGNNPHPSSFSLSAISPQFVKLDPGSFAVSVDTGVSHSFSGDCNGTINAGQLLICTIQITAPTH